MSVSIGQIKAARSLLGWKQQDLADHAGLNIDQVRGIEAARSRPNDVLEAIEKCFAAHGIAFVDGGVIPKRISSYVLDSYMDVLNDIALSMPEGGEVLKHCVDDRRSTPEVIKKVEEMRATGIRERLTISDDNFSITGQKELYRQIPKEYFASSEVMIIYLNKVAFFVDGKVLVIVNENLANVFRAQFEYWWNKGKQL
jgi:transcriptional regulator with XRE-family HTH domain